MVVVAGMFAMMVMSVRSLDAVSKAQRRTSSMTQETLQLERTVVDLETGVRGFMLTDDEIFLEPYRRGQQRLSVSLAKLADLSEPQTDATVGAITLHLNEYIREYTEPLIQGTRRPSVLVATTEGKQRLDSLRGRVRHAQRPAAGDHLERRATSQALRQRMLWIGAGGAGVSVVLLVLLAWVLNRRVLGPVRRVSLAARKLERGDLKTRVATTGAGEIGQLARSFNAMAGALATRDEDLRVQSDRLHGILDHTTTTISVKDRDGRYLLVNERWREAMGQVGADVIGRTDDELFPADVAAAIRVTDLEILRTGEAAEYERDAATTDARSSSSSSR